MSGVDEVEDETHSRFIVKMDDHAAMAGASEDKIMRTTKVITRRPTRQTTDGVYNLRPMDLEEGRISDESREFVLREIDAGRIKIDPTSKDKNNSVRAAIFAEFEKRLLKHRQSKSVDVEPKTTVERQSEVAMSNSDSAIENLNLDEFDDPGRNEVKPRPRLGVTAAKVSQSTLTRPVSRDSGSLAEMLKIPGFNVDVTKQPRVYCQLSPESFDNPTLTFASHWYYTLGGANPTDMVFVIDNRDKEAYDAMVDMLGYLLGEGLADNMIYYAAVSREVPGSDEIQKLTTVDLTCQLRAANLEFGIFNFLVIPLEQ